MFQEKEDLSKEPVRRKVLLLVEDDAAYAEYLVQLLQETPYHVFVATNSFAALNFVKHIKPHLFILDYRLPDMNRLQLYTRLSFNRELSGIPILLLNACLEQCQDEIAARNLIALGKPFNPDTFLLTLKEMLTEVV